MPRWRPEHRVHAGETDGPQISGALQEALVGQLTSEWPNTLTPEQFAMMAFSITAPEAVGLRATITFTDRPVIGGSEPTTRLRAWPPERRQHPPGGVGTRVKLCHRHIRTTGAYRRPTRCGRTWAGLRG